MQRGKIITIVLCTVIVIALGVGGYFLFSYYKTSGISTNSVNKYQDLVDWCESSTQDNELTLNCKALLLTIKSSAEDISSCFNVKIISKDNTLRDASICENSSTVSYTNDVLVYKKLMPIQIDLVFKKDSILQTYTFEKASVNALDQEAIQHILEGDITSLTAEDLSSLTVKNSINFCPNPDKIPSYVGENLKTTYTDFFNKNILSQDSYLALLSKLFSSNFVDNWGNTTIQAYNICNSLNSTSYSGICSTSNSKNLTITDIQELAAQPNWSTDLDNRDITIANQISMLNDGLYYIPVHNNYITPDLVSQIVIMSNDKQIINEEEFCNLYNLYNTVDQGTGELKTDMEYIYDQVFKNIENLSSTTCANIIKDKVDNAGLYLDLYYKNLNNNSILNIYNRCNNLSMYLLNDQN